MTPALNSKSFKSTPSLEVSTALRELVAAMPIVLLVNAVRSAFFGAPSVPSRARIVNVR